MSAPNSAVAGGPVQPNEVRILLDLATPIFMGSLLANLTILFNTILIGRADKTGLLLAGLFLPFSFLVTAVIESMRAPAIVVATRSTRRDEIPYGVVTFAVLGAAILLCVAGAVGIFGDMLFTQLNVPAEVLQRALQFILYMLGSSALLVVGVIANSAVFGIGRGLAAMLVSIAANVLNIAITALCVFRLEQGALGAAWGTASAGVLMIVASLHLLPAFDHKTLGSLALVIRHALALAFSIALPVLGSYLLLTAYLALVNQIILSFGAEVVGGFGITSRLQNVLMLPAAALGTALAIRAGQMHSALDSGKVVKLVGRGIVVAVSLYLLISLTVCATYVSLADVLTGDAAISKVVQSYLLIIAPSYILFGPLLAVLIYLDQVGQGRTALLFNVLTLGSTLAGARFAELHFHDFKYVFLAIAIGNLIAGIAMFFIIRRSAIHQPHRQIAQGGVS